MKNVLVSNDLVLLYEPVYMDMKLGVAAKILNQIAVSSTRNQCSKTGPNDVVTKGSVIK